MVSKRVDVSPSRQLKILRISRSSLYYTPVGFDAETLELMRQIDKILAQYPLFGSRRLRLTCLDTDFMRAACAD